MRVEAEHYLKGVGFCCTMLSSAASRVKADNPMFAFRLHELAKTLMSEASTHAKKTWPEYDPPVVRRQHEKFIQD